jgi:heptosyltransferase-2
MTTPRRNILVVGPSWIGDMVMAHSLFQILCQQIRDVQLFVLAPSWSLPLLGRMPEVSMAIPTPFEHGRLSLPQRFQIAHQLRGKHLDQAIILPQSLKAALVPFLARIPLRTGFLGEKRYGLLNDIRQINKAEQPRTVQRFVQLGRPRDSITEIPPPPPRLVAYPHAIAKILDRLGIQPSEQPVLAICPGASFGPAKRWPASHFAQVAREQLRQGWQVWLMGSREDAQITAEIYGAGPPNLYDLAGRTPLEDVVDLLSVASCVISNDSGLMHVAAAVDTPVIALYGSTSPKVNPPLSSRATILWRELACSPCHQRSCPLGHTNCLHELPVDRVLEALTQATATSIHTGNTSRIPL